jgi:hypothetical protein
MIIFRQKDFGLSDSRQDQLSYLIDGCHTIAMELIKAIDLYFQDNQDVSHWVDKPVGYILKLSGRSAVELHYSLICSFPDSDIIKLIGVDGLTLIRNKYSTPEKFIEEVINEILTDAKYKIWLKNRKFFQSAKDYIKYFKYITLCISGEILPEDWNDQGRWLGLSIPRNPKIRFNRSSASSRNLHQLITSCIEHILGINYF